MTHPELSITLPNFAAEGPDGWEHLLARAELFDRVGIDRLVVSDHVVFGEDLEAYGRPELGGTAGGRQPTGPDGDWLEPLTTLSVVAGRTRRIRLGTNILIAALRRPVVLAKTASTLDVLSGGRLLDHTLSVCRTLWSEQRADFDDPELTFSAIHQMPKPHQPGGVPIWVSGRVQPRVVERIARFGSGWIPWGDDAADPAAGAARMRRALADAGSDPGDLAIVGRLPIADPSTDGIASALDAVGGQVDAGITDLRLGLRLPGDDAAAEDLLVAVVAAFRTVVGRPPPA